MLRIGIDGGATTTRAVVVDEALKILGRGEAGPSNYLSAGMETALENIDRAVAAALGAAGVARDAVGGWGLGLAGACTPVEQALVRDRLRALEPRLPLVVDEDVVAA